VGESQCQRHRDRAWQASLVVLAKIVDTNIKPGTRHVGLLRNPQKLRNFKLHNGAVSCRTGLVGNQARIRLRWMILSLKSIILLENINAGRH